MVSPFASAMHVMSYDVRERKHKEERPRKHSDPRYFNAERNVRAQTVELENFVNNKTVVQFSSHRTHRAHSQAASTGADKHRAILPDLNGRHKRVTAIILCR